MKKWLDFNIGIEDRHAAEFWLQEWWDRFHATNDSAFKEQAEAMGEFISLKFEDVEMIEVDI